MYAVTGTKLGKPISDVKEEKKPLLVLTGVESNFYSGYLPFIRGRCNSRQTLKDL